MGRVGTTYYRRREDSRCAVPDCTRGVAPIGARCQFHRVNGHDKALPGPRPQREAEHGDLLRYQRDRCRCPECRAANAAAARKYQAQRRAAS